MPAMKNPGWYAGRATTWRVAVTTEYTYYYSLKSVRI